MDIGVTGYSAKYRTRWNLRNRSAFTVVHYDRKLVAYWFLLIGWEELSERIRGSGKGLAKLIAEDPTSAEPSHKSERYSCIILEKDMASRRGHPFPFSLWPLPLPRAASKPEMFSHIIHEDRNGDSGFVVCFKTRSPYPTAGDESVNTPVWGLAMVSLYSVHDYMWLPPMMEIIGVEADEET
jgi:hypothetical protein